MEKDQREKERSEPRRTRSGFVISESMTLILHGNPIHSSEQVRPSEVLHIMRSYLEQLCMGRYAFRKALLH